MASGRKYCWDACVFISLLTAAGRTNEEMENLRAIEAMVDNGEIVIFTPSITLIEVLACKLTPDQESLFQAILRRSNVEVMSVSLRVAETAREIRNHYISNGAEMAVPDAIHLATAIHYSATALHTFDGGGKTRKKTDLLKLTNPIIGKYHLDIRKPEPPPSEKADPVGPTSGLLDFGGDEGEGGE
jgi:predicted nucleic acid-binding protein